MCCRDVPSMSPARILATSTSSARSGVRLRVRESHKWQSTRHQRDISGAKRSVVPSHRGWGRATTLLSVLEVRHGSLDSTPAQDSVSSLVGLIEEVALWENSSLTIKLSPTGCLFSTLGVAPFLGNQVATGFEVKSLGELRQVV